MESESKPLGALAGLRVLDMSRMLPGPYCSMILADHGAEVISVEDGRYRNAGHYVPTVNRNKKHMSLDLKHPRGKEIFFRLIRDADVFIEGFRPGVAERLGIDYETLKKDHPRLVYCSISGFGQTGAMREAPGHDVNYLSTSGILDLIGPRDAPPSIPGIQIADLAGGGLNGVIGILLALVSRNSTGRGQHIDISMTDGMVGLLPLVDFFKQVSGQSPQRSDGFLSHRYAFYNTYETSEGKSVSLGAVEPHFWKNICEAFERPDLVSLQYDEERREEIIQFFRDRFKTRTRDEWVESLKGLDLCFTGVNSFDEVLEAPLFREREMVVDLEEKDGRMSKAIGVPVKLSETPGSVRSPADNFGESTFQVLRDLGFSVEEMEKLKSEKVI